MKAILMSIRPEWVAKILNGEKTIEIRQSAPKMRLPREVYIYCTKQIPSCTLANTPEGIMCVYPYFPDGESRFCGKVVAKFTLRKVEGYKTWDSFNIVRINSGDKCSPFEILKCSCLSGNELTEYLGGISGKTFYAWYISDLVYFARPKELSEFGVKRAPQSWQYIEIEEEE